MLVHITNAFHHEVSVDGGYDVSFLCSLYSTFERFDFEVGIRDGYAIRPWSIPSINSTITYRKKPWVVDK